MAGSTRSAAAAQTTDAGPSTCTPSTKTVLALPPPPMPFQMGNMQVTSIYVRVLEEIEACGTLHVDAEIENHEIRKKKLGLRRFQFFCAAGYALR
jgi:hypothetical protein